MSLSRLWNWLGREKRRPTRSSSQQRRPRLHFDVLEDRCVPTFVTTLTDNVAGSLRDAIATATAVGGDGVVEFAPGLTGTITLSAGEIPINGNVIINGPGPANVTVNANNASRVFNIGSSNLTVNIFGLKI